MHPIKKHSRYRFPWRTGNQFKILVDGTEFFEAMLNDIRGAAKYIYMEMYLFESGHVADRFIAAFIQAAERGVRVRILLDAYGAQDLNAQDRKRLEQHDITLCFFNPVQYGKLRKNLFRDHRKILVIDGKTAYTGGSGITDDFDESSSPVDYWHESMTCITGPCVQDWQTLFIDNWNGHCKTKLDIPAETPEKTGTQTGRVVESRSVTHSEVIRSFVTRVRNAEHRIWLTTAYFVPSRKFRSVLRKSARRGIDVRILLPGTHTDHPWVRHLGRIYYERLLRHGVRIFEYQPRFTHLKILLCDHWVSTGSSNTDKWNFLWNLEANQEIDDPEFAHQIEEIFQKDLQDSREIRLEEWSRRPWHRRLRDRFWGFVVSFLSWFTYHKLQNSKYRKK